MLAHGKDWGARQRLWLTAMTGRTAEKLTHGKDTPHGREIHSRQRRARTAKVFAVQFVHAHGKEVFAVEHFAGHSLP
jgi:hypothetical protein